MLSHLLKKREGLGKKANIATNSFIVAEKFLKKKREKKEKKLLRGKRWFMLLSTIPYYMLYYGDSTSHFEGIST